MMRCTLVLSVSLLIAVAAAVAAPHAAAQDDKPAAGPFAGYLQWRGPGQDGNLHDAPAPDPGRLLHDDGSANAVWTFDLPGRGTPVIGQYPDGNRLFVLGYTGEGPALLETLFCLDPETGKELWRRGYPDFISDIIYNRYAIGAPAIDPETGHVFILTSPGLLIALDKDGNELWQVSMMEQYGRLTFPNGRTGSPVIDGDRVIVNAITSNWGSEGPGRNRFYAFDKSNGELIWSSDPGVGPPFLKDSSFSTPVIENRQGHRVFYAGLGDGNLVGVNALTGDPLWRYQMSVGGVNCTPVIYDGGTPGSSQDDQKDDLIIQTHGKENLNDTGRGYMIAINASAALGSATSVAVEHRPVPIESDDPAVAWRNDDASQFTSSPIVVDDTVYQANLDGHLVAINAKTGQTRWKLKVGPDQLHASPIYASGNLYIPFWHNGLIIVPHTPGSDPGSNQAPSFTEIKLEGDCIGSPALWRGRLYIHTTEKLYCFGPTSNMGPLEAASSPTRADDQPQGQAQLLATPAEVLMRPGESKPLTVHVLDQAGWPTPMQTRDLPKWEPWVPATARVSAEMDATIEDGTLVAADDATLSAGAFRATKGGMHATIRGRILPSPPYAEDFESFDLVALDQNDQVHYAHPPLPWIGARLKWQVREDPLSTPGSEAGVTQPSQNKVLAKTLDRVLFQRSMVFLGHPDDANYTVTADVMTDGNRRGSGVVGVINQRYIIALDGMKQQLEVSSNHDRVKIGTASEFKPRTWYRIKSKVSVHDDGSGTIHAKAWPAGEDEPEGWTLEADVPHAHTQGSPGLFGFSPQSRYRVYIDNVKVEPNE